jgi:Na+-transporting methylmalonyl-CoA/oxaloacetate decarboxylase gamma subunit
MMNLLLISSWSELFSGSVAQIIVVIASLILLVILVQVVQSLVKKNSKSKIVDAEQNADNVKNIPAEEIAAIAMALHLYLDNVHDEESNVLTIKRIERRYSPWNSKIYGLNNLHR